MSRKTEPRKLAVVPLLIDEKDLEGFWQTVDATNYFVPEDDAVVVGRLPVQVEVQVCTGCHVAYATTILECPDCEEGPVWEEAPDCRDCGGPPYPCSPCRRHNGERGVAWR
jgi:hypothetical protein